MLSPLPRRKPLGARVALFPSDGSLPRSTVRSASALWLSRPSQRSIVTACELAGSLNDPLHRRLRRSRHLLRRYNCYRLERPLPGGTRSHLETAPSRGAPCCRHYPGAAVGLTVRSLNPTVSTFPEGVVGSACASSFSRLARRSLALRPAHSRCHRIS